MFVGGVLTNAEPFHVYGFVVMTEGMLGVRGTFAITGEGMVGVVPALFHIREEFHSAR